jgi:hypothetical protein
MSDVYSQLRNASTFKNPMIAVEIIAIEIKIGVGRNFNVRKINQSFSMTRWLSSMNNPVVFLSQRVIRTSRILLSGVLIK